MDIRELPELGDLRAPLGKHLVALTLIGPDPERAADMVQDDLGSGESAREIDEIAELGMEHPCLEAQVQGRQRGKALAPGPVHVEPLARSGGEDPQARVGVPGGAVADAAEAPAGQNDMLLQNALGAAA